MDTKSVSLVVMLVIVVWVASVGAATNTSVQISSYGIIQQITPPVDNLLRNSDFSQGFTGLYGIRAGFNPPNSQGWIMIDGSQGHNAAPCMKLTPDPYGQAVASGDRDPGNAGAFWWSIPVKAGQRLHFGFWVKTETDTIHPTRDGGLRCGWDVFNEHPHAWVGSLQNMNANVPIFNTCPTVVWGTSWTLVDIYGTVPSGGESITFWLQAYNGGAWGVYDTTAAYIDDAYLVIVG